MIFNIEKSLTTGVYMNNEKNKIELLSLSWEYGNKSTNSGLNPEIKTIPQFIERINSMYDEFIEADDDVKTNIARELYNYFYDRFEFSDLKDEIVKSKVLKIIDQINSNYTKANKKQYI